MIRCRPVVGRIYYARDYRENVEVLAIEDRGRIVEQCRVTVQRPNSHQTFNYPVYLLEKAVKQ